jgi:uncharacterized membrane protein
MQNPPPSEQKSAVGLEPNLAAALSYIWIVGLIFFLMEKENRFIRFHALQSVLLGVAWTVTVIVLVIVNIIVVAVIGVAAAAAGDAGSILGLIIGLISTLIWLVIPLLFLALLVFAAVKAYQGKIFKLPIIGNMADRIVNK